MKIELKHKQFLFGLFCGVMAMVLVVAFIVPLKASQKDRIILEQAQTIEELAVMTLTYQLYMWENNVTLPDFDELTLKWMRNNLPLESPN